MIAIDIRRRSLALAAALGVAGIALSGCASAIVGGIATTGVVAAQERSVGAAIDDVVIRVDLNRRLFEAGEELYVGVGLDIVEGRVLLTGIVPTVDHRVDAAKLAWLAPGVKEVLNELEVAAKADIVTFVRDKRIGGQLRIELLRDLGIIDINYSITTVNGVIYLLGIAQNQAELDKVVGHASNIGGVKKVVSHVLLKDDPKRR
jgi:osmotically-inducible protein OsmY